MPALGSTLEAPPGNNQSPSSSVLSMASKATACGGPPPAPVTATSTPPATSSTRMVAQCATSSVPLLKVVLAPTSATFMVLHGCKALSSAIHTRAGRPLCGAPQTNARSTCNLEFHTSATSCPCMSTLQSLQVPCIKCTRPRLKDCSLRSEKQAVKTWEGSRREACDTLPSLHRSGKSSLQLPLLVHTKPRPCPLSKRAQAECGADPGSSWL
mmetsp:Transcript_54501/g.122432  ORF Transcript_54501/g.122432 Transcript_54501/m.122432 type:complete len:212 (-) Transcript_54501:54-689(-)